MVEVLSGGSGVKKRTNDGRVNPPDDLVGRRTQKVSRKDGENGFAVPVRVPAERSRVPVKKIFKEINRKRATHLHNREVLLVCKLRVRDT